jgi:hypothetical protein
LVGKVGPVKAQDLKLASEWVEDCVKEYGDTKEGKQQSNRKKFLCRELSVACYKTCEIDSLAKNSSSGNIEHKIATSAVHNNMPHILKCLSNCKIKSFHGRHTGSYWSLRGRWVGDGMHFTV